MTVADLGRVLGNKTAASLVLSGKRQLSKSHIRRLAARFKVEPGLFFRPDVYSHSIVAGGLEEMS